MGPGISEFLQPKAGLDFGRGDDRVPGLLTLCLEKSFSWTGVVPGQSTRNVFFQRMIDQHVENLPCDEEVKHIQIEVEDHIGVAFY